MVRGSSDSFILIAHESFTLWEREQSSTYRELAALLPCIMSLVALCAGAVVIIQTDSRNRTFIAGRSSRSPLNDLAVKLHEFGTKHYIVVEVNWVPRNLN
jgi:hypothetical protein